MQNNCDTTQTWIIQQHTKLYLGSPENTALPVVDPDQVKSEPGTANEKKKKKRRRKFLRGSVGTSPLPSPPSPLPPPPPPQLLPRKILKVETKICAIWGILWANLKKCSTLKFMPKNSFVPSICLHWSIILIFIEKKYACRFFSMENIFFHDFRFSFPWESSFPWWILGSESTSTFISYLAITGT